MAHFLRNLDVRSAVDFIAGNLSVAGNAIHGGGVEEAVLCVAIQDMVVSTAIFSHGKITVYSPRPDYSNQGLCIKDWITLVNSGHVDRLVQPAIVRITGSKE